MKHKKRIIQIVLASVLFALGLVLKSENKILIFSIFLIAYIIIGGKVLMGAATNIFHGKIFDENFLMSVATIGAFAVGEYPEGVAVMLFFRIGELFEDYAVNKSRKSISSLMNIRPDYANVIRDGSVFKLDPNEVEIGETIIVKAGEKIPLDGIIIDGATSIDTCALTGESLPREVELGDNILSGTVNLSGVIKIRVEKIFGESTVSKILDLVENASNKKSTSENFITKFARYYTPIVVIIALCLAIFPPLIVAGQTFNDWIYRSLIFLVISCPCALVISVPLSFFGGIGAASKCGVLIKGSNYLETLAKTQVMVFDKTGTLTQGKFIVSEISPVNMETQELLAYAAYAESQSNHPISMSIKNAYNNDIDVSKITSVEELSGFGVKTIVGDQTILAGNAKLMVNSGIAFDETQVFGTVVYIAVNNIYAGKIIINDKIKDDAKFAISELKSVGVKQTIMLTGDSKYIGEKVSNEIGIDSVYTNLLPEDKVHRLEEIMNNNSFSGKVGFVGDGINDAPVLARADIGIAMGALGSDAAIEAADVVIMTDEPSKIATAMKISVKTLNVVKQNIIFALVIKAIVLILGACGIATMWEAVFADVGVSVLAILNAMRILHPRSLK